MRRFPLLLLVASLALSACKSSSSGTYVALDFVGTVSTEAPIAVISVDLDMGGEKSGTDFKPNGNSGITLPTDGVLKIEHGSGDLKISALAKSFEGQVLGTGIGHGQVVAGQTKRIEVRFGASGDGGTAGENVAPDGAAPTKGSEDASKPPKDGVPQPDGMGPGGAGGSGGTGGGGMTGTAGNTGTLVLTDAGVGDGPNQDANPWLPDAPVGGAGMGGFSGIGGTGAAGVGGTGGVTTLPGVANIISEPSALDFATVGLGKPASIRRTIIRNAGTATAPSLTIALTPANGPFGIESEDCTGKILGAGDTCTVTVRFKPLVVGAANGSLSVKAGSVSGTDISLTGMGASAPAVLVLQPTQGDFGTVNVGAQGSVVFTLSNTGGSPATNIMVSNTGGPIFLLTSELCGTQVVQPTASCTFTMVFAPTAPGPANGTVTVKSPDLPNPLTVNLTGNGKTNGVALKVNLQGNGTGTVSAPGLFCQGTVCTGQYDPGTAGVSVTLNAKPDAYSTFAGWSDGPCSGSAPTCSFVLTGPTMTSAKFTAIAAQVGLSVLGLQGHTGTISSSDGILTCSGQCPPAPHPKTTSMTLVATPAAGSTFIGWTDGPCHGAVPTCTIPLTNDIFVSATFGPQAYMFVTSTSIVPGKLGGVTGADAECAARAQAASLPGTYRAWLSATSLDAKSRVGTGGWVRVDGRPFARTLATLGTATNQIVYYPPRIDEYGKDVGNDHVLVATGSKGDGVTFGGQCGDYSTTSGPIAVGDAITGSSYWSFTQLIANGCGGSYHLYCFSTNLEVDMVPTPVPGKRIFLSNSPWSPFGDISNADAFCRADAVAASLPNASSFVALMATTTAAASTRLTSGTGPWRRMDNVVVFRNPIDMASNDLLATPGVLANGTTGDFLFWSGASGPGVVGQGTSSCQNWSSSSSTDFGQIGNANLSATPEWFASYGNGKTCDSASQRLLCAEP